MNSLRVVLEVRQGVSAERFPKVPINVLPKVFFRVPPQLFPGFTPEVPIRAPPEVTLKVLPEVLLEIWKFVNEFLQKFSQIWSFFRISSGSFSRKLLRKLP